MGHAETLSWASKEQHKAGERWSPEVWSRHWRENRGGCRRQYTQTCARCVPCRDSAGGGLDAMGPGRSARTIGALGPASAGRLMTSPSPSARRYGPAPRFGAWPRAKVYERSHTRTVARKLHPTSLGASQYTPSCTHHTLQLVYGVYDLPSDVHCHWSTTWTLFSPPCTLISFSLVNVLWVEFKS